MKETNLFLSYEGKIRVGLLMNAAISFIKKLVPEKTELNQPLAGNAVKQKLGDILVG